MNKTLEPKYWFVLLVLILITLFFSTSRCNAQRAAQHRIQQQTAVYDTVYCDLNCIEKFVEQASYNGKSKKIFAVYKDAKNDIEELIPVTYSVYDYILTCKELNIKPNLGIKLKNGQIQTLIKYKRKYDVSYK